MQEIEKYWECDKCHIELKYSQSCPKCKKTNAFATPYLIINNDKWYMVDKRHLDDDWICPSCGTINSQQNANCCKCGKADENRTLFKYGGEIFSKIEKIK